jgi:predicted Zn-dependent protease
LTCDGSGDSLGGDETYVATTWNRQLLTTNILALLKKKIPGDAFCLLGITMEDLYPDPSWNFVFGQARLQWILGEAAARELIERTGRSP